MMTSENKWNKPFQGKNLERIYPNYPQVKQIHYDRMEDYNRFKP